LESLSKVSLQVGHDDPETSFFYPKLEGHTLSWVLKLSKNLYTYSAIVIEKYKKRTKGNDTYLGP